MTEMIPDKEVMFVCGQGPEVSKQEMRDLYADAWRDVRDQEGSGAVAELNNRFKDLHPIHLVLASTFGKFDADKESKQGK